MKNLKEARSQIARSTDPAEIYEVLYKWSGHERLIIEAIAGNARVWDNGLVYIILKHGYVATSLLFKNPHRSKKVEDQVLQWALYRLQSEGDRWLLRYAAKIFRIVIDAGGCSLKGDTGQALFDLIKPKSKQKKLTYRQVITVKILLEHPELRQEDLARIYGYLQPYAEEDEIIGVVISHGLATPEMWRNEILGKEKISETLFPVLCRIDRIRRDLVVRSRLVEEVMEPGWRWLMAKFVADAIPTDCAFLFRNLKASAVGLAENVLVENGHKIAGLLTEDDLSPFLASSRREVRLAAITCLSQKGECNKLSNPGEALAADPLLVRESLPCYTVK